MKLHISFFCKMHRFNIKRNIGKTTRKYDNFRFSCLNWMSRSKIDIKVKSTNYYFNFHFYWSNKSEWKLLYLDHCEPGEWRWWNLGISVNTVINLRYLYYALSELWWKSVSLFNGNLLISRFTERKLDSVWFFIESHSDHYEINEMMNAIRATYINHLLVERWA